MTDETFTYLPPARVHGPVAEALGSLIHVLTIVLFLISPALVVAIWKALL